MVWLWTCLAGIRARPDGSVRLRPAAPSRPARPAHAPTRWRWTRRSERCEISPRSIRPGCPRQGRTSLGGRAAIARCRRPQRPAAQATARPDPAPNRPSTTVRPPPTSAPAPAPLAVNATCSADRDVDVDGRPGCSPTAAAARSSRGRPRTQQCRRRRRPAPPAPVASRGARAEASGRSSTRPTRPGRRRPGPPGTAGSTWINQGWSSTMAAVRVDHLAGDSPHSATAGRVVPVGQRPDHGGGRPPATTAERHSPGRSASRSSRPSGSSATAPARSARTPIARANSGSRSIGSTSYRPGQLVRARAAASALGARPGDQRMPGQPPAGVGQSRTPTERGRPGHPGRPAINASAGNPAIRIHQIQIGQRGERLECRRGAAGPA